MNTAFDLGPVNREAPSDQRCYRLEPPMAYQDWTKSGASRFARYVVVSAVSVPFSGPETYIFRSDRHGNVTRWNELPGSFRGSLDHAQALAYAGYAIAGEATTD